MRVPALLCVIGMMAACGGKVVFDDGDSGSGAASGTGAAGTGAAGSGAAGTGAAGTGASGVSCLPDVNTAPDGIVDLEGPAPLATAEAYPLLRALHAAQPEGERFDVQNEGHIVAVEAVLFADDDVGDIIAEVYYLCEGDYGRVATARVPKVELPDYDGIHSDLWVTRFEFDEALPVTPGTTVDVLFHPEGVSAVSGVASHTYPFGEMVSVTGGDVSTLGDYAAQLEID